MKKLLCILMVCCGCASAQNKLEPVSWLIGSWKMDTPEGIFIEAWSRNDSCFTGASTFVSPEGEELFSEELKLAVRDGKLYYIATVPDQNEGKPVLFAEQTITDKELVFENAAHDWPQRIIYNKTSDKNCTVLVEGTENGVYHKEEFQFIKQ